MDINNLKPIPKYIEKLIENQDKKYYRQACGNTRFYSYLTRWQKELIKITVAVKQFKGARYYKQVAVHSLHSPVCFAKDIDCYIIGGYVVCWYSEGLQKYAKSYADGKWYTYKDKYFDPYAPCVNLSYVLNIPQFKYCAINGYNQTSIFKYLRCYEKYPQAEYLIKLGLPNLADKRTILALLKKDKAFRRWIIKNKDICNLQYNNASSIIHAYKTGNTFEESRKFIERKSKLYLTKKYECDYSPIKKLFRGKALERFFAYIDEQKINYGLYLDYLNACNDLQLDMSLSKNAFPHDFMRWHDIRIDECASKRAQIDERKRKELYKKFAVTADKFLPLQNIQNKKYAVFIAKSPAELINEGNALRHCVGKMGYDEKMARGETLIFFVRRLTAPDKPFVTMEYSVYGKNVLQCYGNKNTKPNNNVLDFVNNCWLPFANEQLKSLRLSKAA